MALTLTINDTVIKARPSIQFAKEADEKYGTYEKNSGKNVSGVNNIVIGILSREPQALVQFFDCAFAYIRVGRPTVEQVEDALNDLLETYEDVEVLFAEIYNAFVTAGLLKVATREFWTNIDMQIEMANEADKAQAEKMKTVLEDRAESLTQLITNN